jgi:NAD(P)-dependent dehydrogenase (short-subunit alcohol dehydrogenase family)
VLQYARSHIIFRPNVRSFGINASVPSQYIGTLIAILGIYVMALSTVTGKSRKRALQAQSDQHILLGMLPWPPMSWGAEWEVNLSYLEDLFSVKGKTALVTGGATGIGRMVATALVRGGATVLMASRKGEACEATAAEINALGEPGTAVGFAGDVGTEEGIRALAEEVGKRTDKLHILVNNAGVTWGEPLDTFPHKAWQKVMNVNVGGLFTLTRDLLPLLDAASSDEDPARIINLGSVMGTQPVAEGAYSYSASKAAVHHLTRILAGEFAGRRITVNAFAPGPFQSKMTAFATATDEQAKKVGGGVPLGRIGSPDDIAAATLYLCGKSGTYVTGAILPLDGGLSAHSSVGLFADAL